MNQTELFESSESDAWFRRNKASLLQFDAERDPLIRLIRLFQLRPRRVLEIGASNGARVSALATELGATATAIEPSKEAIEDGRHHHPHVRFLNGVCHALPTDERFDLVLLNYVFSWVDRSLLMASMAEVDRVVEDGGHLIIGDFFSTNFVRVRYHHVETSGVYTYKQDYSIPFVATGLYERVSMVAIEHHSGEYDAAIPPTDRSHAWLLRKTLSETYVDAERSA